MTKPEKKYQQEVGRMLRAARGLSGLTTEHAARVAGVTVTTICNWERGEYAAHPVKLFALCIEYAFNGVDQQSLAERMDAQDEIVEKVAAAKKPTKDEINKLVMLRDMRESAGLTQVQLGKILGIKRCSVGAVGTAVSEIERGIRYPEDLKIAALKWIDEQERKKARQVAFTTVEPQAVDIQFLFEQFVKFMKRMPEHGGMRL